RLLPPFAAPNDGEGRAVGCRLFGPRSLALATILPHIRRRRHLAECESPPCRIPVFGCTATPRLYQITSRKVNRSHYRTRTCNRPLTKLRNRPRRRPTRLRVLLGLAPATVAASPLTIRDSAVGVCDSLVINLPRLPRQPLGVPPCLRLLLEGLHVVAEAPAVVAEGSEHAARLLLVFLRRAPLAIGHVAHELGHRVSPQRVLVDVADKCQRPVVQQRIVKCFKSRNHGFNHSTASLRRFVSG